MSRYSALKALGLWSVIDRLTGELLPQEQPMRALDAKALAGVLNSLESQQNWRAEAELWPTTA